MRVSTLFEWKRPEIRALHLTWIAFYICFFVWFGMAPLASSMLKSVNWLTPEDLKLFAIANVALTIPARILVGMALDHWGPRRVFSVLLVVMAVPALFFAFGDSRTQLLVSRLQRDAAEARTPNLRQMTHLFEAAAYVGALLVDSQVKCQHTEHGHDGVNTQATLIFGGQIAGEQPGLYMVYPLGNAIAASPETPYLQIGESKYGKPILDRILGPATRLEDAARTALLSLDSTIRSNLSVGLPIDMVMLRKGELQVGQQLRFTADSPLYADIHNNWSRRLEQAVASLPRFPWEAPGTDA